MWKFWRIIWWSPRGKLFIPQVLHHFFRRPNIFGYTEDKILHWSISICSYNFTCSCRAGYIGCPKEALSKCISEDSTSWFSKSECEPINSSVLENLVNSGHRDLPDKFFRIIYRAKRFGSKGAQISKLYLPKFVLLRLITALLWMITQPNTELFVK